MKMHAHSRHTILSVDDDPDLLFATRMVMRSLGYDVRSSLNGNNIWTLLSEEIPDIILMDIQMDGMNGDLICSILKKGIATKNIPVILLSGNEDIERAAKECGADAFIRKPFTGSEVKACISTLIGPYSA